MNHYAVTGINFIVFLHFSSFFFQMNALHVKWDIWSVKLQGQFDDA